MARSSTTAPRTRPAPPPADAPAPVDGVLAFKRLTQELEETRAENVKLKAALAAAGARQPPPKTPDGAGETPRKDPPAPEKRGGFLAWMSKDL